MLEHSYQTGSYKVKKLFSFLRQEQIGQPEMLKQMTVDDKALQARVLYHSTVSVKSRISLLAAFNYTADISPTIKMNLHTRTHMLRTRTLASIQGYYICAHA